MVTSFPSLDFDDFHRGELPRRLARGNGAHAASDGLEHLGPLAFRLPSGDAWTYRPRPGGVDVVAGDAEANTVIELAREDWEGIVHDLETPPGLLYSGRVRCARGDAMRFVRWEPGLRAMYHGRPIFDPDATDLRDRNGAPLDPRRAFRWGDDRDDMAHFLRTAGFLLVEQVFTAQEVARLRDHAETLHAAAVEGDRKSWWAKNREGEAVLCRVTDAGRIPEMAELYQDPRILELAALAEPTLVCRAVNELDGVSVLFKKPDIVEGLSDLPWHRDCGMGGHACMCPVLIFSIYLLPGRPETGELRMLPGSHQASCGFFETGDPRAPQGISLAGDPGDVSLHYGDIMHAAPPPTGDGPFRQCVLLAFTRPDAYNHRGLSSYNDVLLSRDDGQVEHLQKVVDRT